MSLDYVTTILQGVPMTLLLTFAGLGLGIVGGIPLAVLRQSRIWPVRTLARLVIDLLRGIPIIVWLFIVIFGLGAYIQYDDVTLPVVLGLGLISSAYLAEIYRGGLAAIHAGQFEASTALGMTRLDTMARIVGPQIARISITAAATYGIGLLKDSSIAFTVGVQEVMYWTNDVARTRSDAIGPYVAAGLLYIVLSVLCAWGARSLDGVLRRRVAR